MNKYAQNWKNDMLEELHGWEKKNPADVGVMVINDKALIIDLTDIEAPEIGAELIEDGDLDTALAIAWAKLTEQDIPDNLLYDYDEDDDDDDEDDDDDDVTTLYDTECGDRVIIEGIVHIVCECDGENILCVNLSTNEKEYYDIDTECEIL